MRRLKSRKIDVSVIKGDKNNPTNKYVYINDELTANNRRLLWMAKTKAKECGWKFVWTRNGHIYAKKSETSLAIIISNNADIEIINITI